MTHVPEGFVLELVAAEPAVQDPVAIDWGADGTLWVAEMADYPYGMDGEGKPGGRVRRLRDEDGDGRYESFTVFLEGLSFPTSVMPWRRGVLVTAAPDLWYAEDTNGDGVADRKEAVFTGFMQGNQQLRVNSLRWGLDNWVYAASGGHHAGFGQSTTIRAVASGEEFALGSRDFRFDPDRGVLEPLAGPSQFGRVRDDWGNWFGVQNSFPLWHYVLEDRYLSRNPSIAAPDVRRQLRLPPNPRVYPRTAQKRFHSFEQSGRFTSACGPAIYRDERLFGRGDADRMHAFTCEPFHNVVQHHVLTRDGASFRGERAESEGVLDFFASADRWCRPVMARTGPDGALWVVDMYRYMIEHPDWLPEEGREELKPHYRSGEDQGRIYRIRRRDRPPGEMPRFENADGAKLIELLASPNGTVRDMAHRLLVTDNNPLRDERLVGLLEGKVATHPDPRTRLHALGVLEGWERLGEEVLAGALRDSHFAVRWHALRLVEAQSDPSLRLRELVWALRDDPDEKVRWQLACTLGEWADETSGKTLAALAERGSEDALFRAAILSSAGPHYEALVEALVDRPAYVSGLLAMAMDDEARLARFLERVLASNDWGLTGECWERIWAHHGNVSVLLQPEWEALRALVPRWEAVLEEARKRVVSKDEPLERRAAALVFLGHQPGRRRSDLERVGSLLTPQTDPDLQRRAAAMLLRWQDEEATERVLAHWGQFTPEIRNELTGKFLDRPEQAARLLEALGRGDLAMVDIGPVYRQRLLNHSRNDLASLARELWPEEKEEGKVAKAARYKEALELAGDAVRGANHFRERCGACHRLGDEGTMIGPDLRSLTDRTREAFLESILDPSGQVEPRYVAYTVELRGGGVVYGLILSETGNGMVIQELDGVRREVLRSEVERVNSSRLSLMPEGLEEGLGVEGMADLLAYLEGATGEGGQARSD